MPETGVYALACSPDGKTLAVSGFDGKVRLLSTVSGEVRKTFVPVEIEKSPENIVAGTNQAKADAEPKLVAEESLAKQLIIESLATFPSELKVSFVDHGQIIIVAKLKGSGSGRTAWPSGS